MSSASEWELLQAAFTLDIQRPSALDKSEECRARATLALTGNDRLSPVEQLEIYRRQFWLRHTSSLLEDFPGLSGLLGQSAWETLVESYLQRFPPDSWTLRDLGKHFVEHVQSSTWLEHHALAVDMATLEWAYTELFDAPDSGVLDPAKLSHLPPEAWERARLHFSPSLRLLRTRYPVARLRRSLRDAAVHALADPIALPAPRAENLVLYRDRDGSLCYSVVGDAASALLEALHAGRPLLEACEAAATRVPDSTPLIESKLGDWFATWGARGWIIDVSCS